MLGNKGDGYDDKGNPVTTCADNLIFRLRADPLKRADPALVTYRPVKIGPPQLFDNGRSRSFDMVWIRVAPIYNLLRQSVCGKQNSWPGFRADPAQDGFNPGGDGGNKTPFFRITTDRSRWCTDAGLTGRSLPIAQA